MARRLTVFPLTVGNRWTFQYAESTSIMMEPEALVTDTGRAYCTVVGRTLTSDSTIWLVAEVRDIFVCIDYFFFGRDTCYPFRDSTVYELIEIHLGAHRLYRPVHADNIIHSLLPYGYNLVDTSGIYRYRPVDSTGTYRMEASTIEIPTVNAKLTFQKDVGPLSVDLQGAITGAFTKARHRLIHSIIVSIDEKREVMIPATMVLSQNYPNPFNPSTNIRFQLPIKAHVLLNVFDVLGRHVATLLENQKDPGMHEVTWDAGSLASGVYFYRIQAGRFVATKKLILMK